MEILGVDIGGSGIKGALVDVATGKRTSERHRIDTPQPATPDAVVSTIGEIADHFGWAGPLGCGYPGVVRSNVVYTAANMDDGFIGVDLGAAIQKRTGQPAVILNDADAAGLAEMRFGAGRGRNGVVFVITIGTGLGTVMFSDGQLVPNTELGHLVLAAGEAEELHSDRTRKELDMSWKRWAKGFNTYLQELHRLFWPELFILGGGAAKKADKFMEFIDVPSECVIAEQGNFAGIVGAALAANEAAWPEAAK